MHSDNRQWKNEILDDNKKWKTEIKDHMLVQIELLRKDVFDVQLERLQDFIGSQKDILAGLEYRISRLEQQSVG